MPRPDPRQRLLREAGLVAAAAVVALVAALWWATAPMAVASSTTSLSVETPRPVAPAAQRSAPGAPLWQALGNEAAPAAAPPPPPPNLRLITLSQRDGRWTALVDPGTGSQRVAGGETIAGWRVESVTQDGVTLSEGARRHQLRIGP